MHIQIHHETNIFSIIFWTLIKRICSAAIPDSSELREEIKSAPALVSRPDNIGRQEIERHGAGSGGAANEVGTRRGPTLADGYGTMQSVPAHRRHGDVHSESNTDPAAAAPAHALATTQ